MKAEAEILWRLFEEHRVTARHHDEQREKITHCILLLVAAALGLLQFIDLSEPEALALALFVILAGFGGWKLTATHSEDCDQDVTCATRYREKLEALYSETRLPKPPPEPVFVKGRPWKDIHLLIVALGVALALLIMAQM